MPPHLARFLEYHQRRTLLRRQERVESYLNTVRSVCLMDFCGVEKAGGTGAPGGVPHGSRTSWTHSEGVASDGPTSCGRICCSIIRSP